MTVDSEKRQGIEPTTKPVNIAAHQKAFALAPDRRAHCSLITGVMVTALGAMANLVGFATPYWVDVNKKYAYSYTRLNLQSAGLWRICMRSYVHPRFPELRFQGCEWVFSRVFKHLRDVLMPEWYVAIQLFMTFGMIIMNLLLPLIIVLWISRCRDKRFALERLVRTVAILMLLAVAFNVIALAIYIVKWKDANWVDHPQLHKLSWSFMLSAAGTFLIFCGEICMLFMLSSVRKHRKKAYKAIPPRQSHRPGYQQDDFAHVHFFEGVQEHQPVTWDDIHTDV